MVIRIQPFQGCWKNNLVSIPKLVRLNSVVKTENVKCKCSVSNKIIKEKPLKIHIINSDHQ